jgi:hypothetical protein
MLGPMFIAVSHLGAVGLGLAAFVLLILVGGAVGGFGRAAERITAQGNDVRTDRPEFRRPPDEGGLL